MTPQRPVSSIGRWWWLAVASLAIGLVVLAPATLLEKVITQSSNAGVRFAADSGTIWTGRGQLTVVADTVPLVIPVVWRFDPRSLLGLRLGFVIEANAPALSGHARVGLRPGEIELRATSLSADARLLAVAHPAAALFSPIGRVRLQQSGDERLGVRLAAKTNEAWRVDGAISLHTEQLTFGGIINAPAGSHEISLRGEGSTVKMSVLRSSGALKLEGAGTVMLATPRRITFSGFAMVAEDAPSALKQLGPLQPDGRQRIELNSTW